MSLISMAVYDTVENERTKYTKRTLDGLLQSVNWANGHRLIIVDNNSCVSTQLLYKSYIGLPGTHNWTVIYNRENLGTAEAINLAWKQRRIGEHCIKIDNDIIIHDLNRDWVEQLESVVAIDPKIGQVGLKRVDCIETTEHPSIFYRSKLRQLSHKNGSRWIVVEEQMHVMGSCVLHSSALLDKIGYLFQVGVYGFDDSFMSFRAQIAGFKTVMLPHILIEHIDTGENPYQKVKEAQANEVFQSGEYKKILEGYRNGTKSIYYNPYDKESKA